MNDPFLSPGILLKQASVYNQILFETPIDGRDDAICKLPKNCLVVFLECVGFEWAKVLYEDRVGYIVSCPGANWIPFKPEEE